MGKHSLSAFELHSTLGYKVYKVHDPYLLKLIKTCDDVIKKVRTRLNRGPANQKPTFTNSKYSCVYPSKSPDFWKVKIETILRAQASYFDWRRIQHSEQGSPYSLSGAKKNEMQFYIPENETDPNEVHPMRIAAAALANKTGYCTEHAAVTYIMLRDALTPKETIIFGRYRIKHWFCLVSTMPLTLPDPSCISKNDYDYYAEHIIVVDPWHANGTATIWKHMGAYDQVPYRILKSTLGHMNRFKNQKVINAERKYEDIHRQRDSTIKSFIDREIQNIENQALQTSRNANTIAEEYIAQLKGNKEISMYDQEGDIIAKYRAP
jgi:hypothetical protein